MSVNNEPQQSKSCSIASHCCAVGDELAFRCGSIRTRWEIHTITAISPSGLIKCGMWELNPDLTIRGKRGNYGPFAGEPVTEEIRQEMLRAKWILSLSTMTRWGDLSNAQLAEIVRIIQSA